MPGSTPGSRAPGRRGRRRLAVASATALVVAVLVVFVPLLALRSAGVRRAILSRAGGALGSSTGTEVTARDFALHLGERRIVLDDLAVAAAGAERPFLVVERIAAVLDARTLLRRPVRLVELDLDGARLDLSAPLPVFEPAETPVRPAAPLPVEILRITLDGGTIVGTAAAAEGAAARLGVWGIEELGATASLTDQRLDVAIDRGTLRLAGLPPAQGLAAEITGRVSGAPAGPFTVDRLRLVGDGLDATVDGTLGLDAADPLRMRVALDADPGRLLPETGPSRLRAAADLDLRSFSGTIEVDASDLPAELLEPALGAGLLLRLGAAGTFLDGEADLELAARDRLSGTARLVWREGEARGRAPLLIVEAVSARPEPPASSEEPATARALADAGAPAGPILLDVDATLLPSWSGRRTASARLQVPAWNRSSEIEIVRSDATLDTDDVARLLRDVETRFPGLLPALPEELPLAGPLSIHAEATGTVADPTIEMRGEWRPQPAATVRLVAGGRPIGDPSRGRRIDARAEVSGLDLAAIDGLRDVVRAGSASGTIDLALEGERVRARAVLDGRELLLASDRRLDAVHVELSGTPRAIEIERLEIAAGDSRLAASGRLGLDPASARWLRDGTLDVTLDRPLEGVAHAEARLALAEGRLRVDGLAASTDYGDVSGRLDVPLGALAGVAALAAAIEGLPTPAAAGPIEIAVDAPALDAAALLRRLELGGPATLGGDLALTLHLDPARPAAGDAVLTVRNFAAADGEARLAALDTVTLRLAGGRLTLEPISVAIRGERLGQGPAVALRIAGEVDLATEWEPGGAIADLAGPLRLEADAETLDGAALLAALGVDPPFESLRADGVELRLAVDPDDPAAAQGTLAVLALDAELAEDHRVRLREPLSIRLDDRRVRLAPLEIELDDQRLTVNGEARFDPAWRPGLPMAELVAAIDASVAGALAADALNPYLAGAAASGQLVLDAAVTGRLDALAGHARLVPGAGGAEIVLFDPYYTRLRDPRLELAIAGGAVTIESATAELNQGSLRLTGGAGLAEGTLDLAATLDEVRYRLDYGLMTQASGELRLTRAAGEPLRLEGRIVLDRGILRRDLDADREILRYLFAPEPAEAPGALDDLELDLELATVGGVRIHNNLADLRATWAPLTITGTLGAPLLDGTIDLDPGGYLFAYGQTVRVDNGRMELRGDGSPPEIELETTTSIEDPSVARAARGRGFVDLLRDPPGSRAAETQDLEAAIGGGLADYYGERIANRLSEGLGALDVSLRPILVFGLDNPGTELTVSRGLSAYVTAAVSISLREEGRQTYVAEVHDIESLERFVGQLYTLHEREDPTAGRSGSSEGVVVQQRLLFGGGGAPAEATGPRLRRLVVDAAETGIGRRAVRRTLGYERGRPLADDATFEAEIEIAELLRRRGFPGARVTAALEPAGEDRVDLRLVVDPGPRVEIEFRGTELHPRQQRMIASIYRPDFYQPVSLEEMREQAVRELRAAGYVDPVVGVAVEHATSRDDAAARATADRTVIVEAAGGERVPLGEPRFAGIDADAAAAVALRFPSAVLRAELAAGELGADRRLRAALSEYGYPNAAIVTRGLEPSGPGRAAAADAPAASASSGEGRSPRRPFVVIAPAGPRHRIAEVRVTGIDDEEARGLAPLATARAGDPVRSDAITRGTIAIEDALQEHGHTRARVRAQLLRAVGPEHERILDYQVDRAGVNRVADVTLAGLRGTRRDWAAGVAALEPGSPLSPASVRAARRRLFETGLFDSVLPQIDYPAPGSAGVTFVIEEKPRFEVAYGVLWQSDEGASAVVDAVDHNALGRAITLGTRARYRGDDRSGRLYGLLPRVLGTTASIEAFAEYREQRDDDPLVNLGTDTFELDLHAVLPLRRQLVGRVYARYRDIEIFELEPHPVFPFPPQTFEWPTAGLQLVWDRRDDPVSTVRGTFASADLSGADETLGSDFSYVRLFTRASHHLPFGSFQGQPFLWAQSARVGLARAFREQSLVGFELLFAGGEYSIRGYDENSIGPGLFDDVEEQALAVINQELRAPLWGDLLTGVLFFDAGQVWDDSGDLGRDFLTSGGLGLRARTPAGILRLDVAYPFDRRPGDDEVTFYFGLGNTF